MFNKTIRPLIYLLISFSLINNSFAKEYERHQHIINTAVEYIESHSEAFEVAPEVFPGTIDTRLKLSKCDQPITAFEPHSGLKGGKGVIGIRCSGGKPWKIYVPMNVRLPGFVLVASKHIARGEMISKNNIHLSKIDLASTRSGYSTDTKDLYGKLAKRSIRRGKVITESSLKKVKLIKRGSDVIIMSSNPAFRVRMKGKALSNGAKGEIIKVKNKSSGRVITAKVVRQGVVYVSL